MITLLQYAVIADRSIDPAPQTSAAHGRCGTVESARESMFVIAGQTDFQFQVATTGGVQQDAVAALFHRQTAQMRQGAALGVAHVLQQGAGGAKCQLEFGDTETAEIMCGELCAQQARGAVRVEMPGRQTAQARPVAQCVRQCAVFADQQLCRLQSRQFTEQCLVAVQFLDSESAGTEFQYRQSVVRVLPMQRHEQILAALVEQRFVGQRAGREDAHHPALHRTFGRRGIADLLAQRHRFAEPHQSGKVLLGRVVGHTGHGDRFAAGLATRGQRDVEQARGLARVLEEQLVEIAHTVEQQGVGMLRLDAQVLLHHGRVCGKGVGCGGHGALV